MCKLRTHLMKGADVLYILTDIKRHFSLPNKTFAPLVDYFSVRCAFFKRKEEILSSTGDETCSRCMMWRMHPCDDPDHFSNSLLLARWKDDCPRLPLLHMY